MNIMRSPFGSFDSMKELYHLRWNEETSFRALKYHSKKRTYIQQEIYARLIMFHLSKAIVNVVDAEKQGKNINTRRTTQARSRIYGRLCGN